MVFFLSELIVNRILIVSIVINKICSATVKTHNTTTTTTNNIVRFSEGNFESYF